MDRENALNILGLSPEATPDEINKRVDVLYKKFRNIEKDENGHTIADIDAAYRFLVGIEYYDREAELRKKRRQEHPNPVFKLLRVDEEKARNAIYYYKWHVIIGLAIIALIVSMVLSVVNRVEPNLKIIVAGDLYLNDTAPLEERVKKDVPGATEVLIQNIVLSDSLDPQMQVAMQQKFSIEIMEGENDLYILDEPTFKEMAKLGAFVALEQAYAEIGIPKGYSEDLVLAMELDDGEKYEPRLYGLDVTDSTLLKEAGLQGDRFIVALGHEGKWPENSVAFIEKMLETIP